VSVVEVLFLLLFCHALADYPLQGDFLAQGKNRHTPVGKVMWPHCLTAHAFIHGGFVYLVTGCVWLGIAEVVAHWLIDFAKCERWFGINLDQTLHILCKICWVTILMAGVR
jgi:hypothetical protein